MFIATLAGINAIWTGSWLFWCLEVKEYNVFANSLMSTIIQDGGKRERSNVVLQNPVDQCLEEWDLLMSRLELRYLTYDITMCSSFQAYLYYANEIITLSSF